MGERRCRYCEKTFHPSKYQAGQAVCSEVSCQKRRRSDYRQQKLVADQEYRQVCQDSSRKCRSRNPDYWKAVARESSRICNPKPGKAEGPGSKTASAQPCKQHLSFGPKAFGCGSLAFEQGGGRACKQQLSVRASLGDRSTSETEGSGSGLLQTTTGWRVFVSCRTKKSWRC